MNKIMMLCNPENYTHTHRGKTNISILTITNSTGCFNSVHLTVNATATASRLFFALT